MGLFSVYKSKKVNNFHIVSQDLSDKWNLHNYEKTVPLVKCEPW